MIIGIIILILIGAGWECEQWFVSHRAMKLWENAGKPCQYRDWAAYVKANGCPGACEQKMRLVRHEVRVPAL